MDRLYKIDDKKFYFGKNNYRTKPIKNLLFIMIHVCHIRGKKK